MIGTLATLLASAGAGYLGSQMGSGGGDNMTNYQRDLAPFTSRALISQRELYDAQKALLDIFGKEYKDLVPQLAGILGQKMEAKALPLDVARQLRQYYDRAGTKLGTYFAGKGTMDSGSADVAFGKLSAEEAAQKLAALLGERRQGVSETLSFMGRQPTVQSPQVIMPTMTSEDTQTPQIDWTNIGSLFANMFDKPSALPMSGAEAANWGFREMLG